MLQTFYRNKTKEVKNGNRAKESVWVSGEVLGFRRAGCSCVSVQDLSPGSVEEAEEAEPDDEFRDAIEVE